MTSRRARSLAAVCSLVAALACQPRGKAVQPGDGKPADGGSTGGGAYGALAPVTHAVEVLPASTLAMLEVAGAKRLADIIGRDALVAKFPAEYKQISGEISRNLGRDILDPAQLASIGVDADGRMGMALLGVEPFRFAAWVTLSDAGKFRSMVFELLRKKGTEAKVLPLGGAEVLELDSGRSWLVLRAPLAIIVGREGGEAQGNAPALEIASADPNRALANDKDFRRATGGLAPADAMAYFDGAALWREVEGEMKEEPAPAPSNNWARDELEAARARGEKPERLAELEAQAKDVDESNKTWEQRRKAERELTKQFFAGVGTGAWSFASKPGGIVGEGRIELADDSTVRKILRNQTTAPALPRALDGRPLWMVTGAFEPDQLVSFVDLAMQADGTSWKQAGSLLKGETGLDLDADLKPLLTGALGFAVTLDGEFRGDIDTMLGKLGLGVDIEVTDGAKAQAVLDKLGNAALAELKKKGASKDQPTLKRDGKGWSIDVPKWRKVFVSVAGTHLVISSDKGLDRRIAGSGTGSAGKLGPSAAMAAAGWERAAFGTLLDLELSTWMFGGLRSTSAFGMAMSESSDDAKVPKSRAYKAKQKQIAAVDAKLSKQEAKRNAAQLERVIAVTHPWGALAGSVREDGNALVLSGGLFVRAQANGKSGGIAGALMESLTAVKSLTDSELTQDGDLTKLFEQRGKLEEELRKIREDELAKYRAKHPGSAPAVVPPLPVDAPAPPR